MPNGAPAIGIVGVGLIGTALARRLIAAGFSVIGYDIDPAKAADLTTIGGETAPSLVDLAARCACVILAVFDTQQVEDALEGAAGLLSGPNRAARRFICVSTCDPERIRALGRRLAVKDVALLEAPLSGTSDQVARHDAVALVAGDEAAVAESEDIFRAIAKQHYYLGAIGNGNAAKLAVNLILGLNRAALAEGLVFAERLGLPLDAFLEVARGSAAFSQVMDVKGEKMLRGDFAPHGRIVQSRKDFGLILQAAAASGQRLPFASVYAELMEGCIAHGESDWDNVAVIQQIRRERLP